MGQSGPRWARSAAALAIAIALTSCTSANSSPQPTEPSTSDSPPAPPSPTAPPSDEPTVEDQVAALWKAVHRVRLDQVYADAEPDGSVYADLATDDAATALADLVKTARGDLPTELVDAEYWPEVEVSANGTEATLADCIIVATRSEAQPDTDPAVDSQVWMGTVEKADGTWRLSSIAIGHDDCVPAQLEEPLIDAYRAWHEAKNQWWDPPDPGHRLLEETMVGPGLTDMRDLLAEHATMEIVVRDRHDLDNAVVFELGIDRARISDCYPAGDGDLAAYDPESGDRREDLSPTPQPGQLDRTVVDLESGTDGTWKVNGWRSETGSDCTPGGTPYVVAP